MLQSIFSADFDLDRLLSFASSVTASSASSTATAAAAANNPPLDSKSSDSGLPPDDCCHGDDSPEPSEQQQQHQLVPPQQQLRLIVRGDSTCVGGCGGCPGSDLVILTSRYDEPIRADLDIRTAHIILTYMEEFLADKEKLQQEWLELTAAAPDISQMSAGAEPKNACKNRYADRLPYDKALVRLCPSHSDADPEAGYINASFHPDSSRPSRRGTGGHILTQGPLDGTVGDFWRLVWQSGATAVVNLTRLTSPEGDELCAAYWPERGSQVYGDFEVHLVSEHVCRDEFVIRSLRLRCRGAGTRTVTQFHYMAWDECGLPESAASLLEFRRKVNKSYKSRSSPVIVHCSDGCGRSGAYCLLDTALNRIAAGVKEVNLAATLEHLRDQRPCLVDNLEQFEFVFTAVAEEVDAVLRSLH